MPTGPEMKLADVALAKMMSWLKTIPTSVPSECFEWGEDLYMFY